MNNHSYGGGKVQDVTLNSTNNCLTIHYTSGDTTDVALAKASEVLDGLMSKEDKVKLDSLSGNYSSSLSSTVSTVEKLGGIAAGTTVAQLTGKSYNEIFDTLIFPTVNPTFTNPSASISLKSYSNIQEIGAVAPTTANFNVSFNAGAINLAGTKQNNRAGAQVNVIETIKVNGKPVSPGSNKDVNITVPTVTVTGVASEDKILKLSGGTLSSELSLSYSTETKKIILSGQDSVEIASIDATQFVKDGMVQNVSFDPETKVLTIAFNTDAGIENIEVDLASLVDAYTAGSGITISKNVISVDTSIIATKQSVTDIDTKLGSGFSSESTVSQQLAAVKTTAEAATTVSEVDNQIDVKLAELTVADKDSGFVRSVTQTNGLIEVTKLPILETDIPNLSISKINNLQSELNNKVPTTRKVNGLSLNQDITLKGSDIALTGYEKGTESSSIVATDTINKAISKLENKIDVAASTGVQSIGGAVGVITLRNGQAATSPAVNLTIAEKELRADVIGVATTAQGNKADTALQSVTASGSNYLTLTANSKSGTTQNLTGSITIQSITTASSEQNGLVEANDVKEYVTSMFQWVDFV